MYIFLASRAIFSSKSRLCAAKSCYIIAPMSIEREDCRRPFEDTKKAYRSAYETLVGDSLATLASPLLRKVAAEESRLLVHSRKMKDGEETESHAQGESDVIAFNLGRESVPVALPVGYRGRKGAPENRHNMAQTYLFADESLEEVGGLYKMTREGVRQQVKAAARQMLRAAPQDGLPIETLNFTKPKSDHSRDRHSLAHGGLAVRIMAAVKRGATYDELIRGGYTPGQLASARKILAGRQQPVDVPRRTKDWRPVLELLANPQTEREAICKLIWEVPDYVFRRYPGVFVDLGEVARGAGLYPRLQRNQRNDLDFIANYLEWQNEPVGHAVYGVKSGKQKGGRWHYFFTLKRYQEEIKQLFLLAEGPRFDKMRRVSIRVIGPMPEKMPTTYDLSGRRVKGVTIKSYSRVLDLLGPYGISYGFQLRSLNINLKDLIGPNPPVSVFSWWSGFYVADVNRRALGVHLGKALRHYTLINRIIGVDE